MGILESCLDSVVAYQWLYGASENTATALTNKNTLQP
jgi:hypothetical protein